MKKIFLYIIFVIILIIAMPIIFTNQFEKTEEVSSNNAIEEIKEKFDYGKFNKIKLLHSETGRVEELDLDTYLYGVVASEMPADFDIEALKAQAVVARTYTVYQIKNGSKHEGADICDNSTCCQAWISKENRFARWEENKREEYWNKIVKAVDDTKGKFILYEKEPINALFHSNSGGKTELSKALAESLFGDENALIRIDMSEYMEPHSISKLIGSPPGYVGFEEGGQLTEKIRRKPYSVILFDEIEKAHPDVMNMLLQILDDGRLTDSNGRTVNFKNTVVIMTSNVGARLITDKKSLGFSKTEEKSNDQKDYETTKKEVMAELKREFRPEFLNRIDEIIVFHKLNDDEISKIIDIMLEEVKKRLNSQKYEIEFSPDVKKLISSKGIDKKFGARPLRRTIQNLVEDRIVEAILDGKVKKGKKSQVSVDGEKIVIK